jgi:hypothetical protein
MLAGYDEAKIAASRAAWIFDKGGENPARN